MIAQRLEDSEIQGLQQMFKDLDTDKDGTLTPKEIQEGMQKSGLRLPPDLADIMRHLDTDGSGCIDYTEFIAATLSTRHFMQKEVLWAAFRQFDADSSGEITKEELRAALE